MSVLEVVIAMNADENKGQRLFRGFRRKERIDTQIHRRRTVKAFSPLELEWESSPAGPASEAINIEKETRRLTSDPGLPQKPTRATCDPLSDHHT